MKNITTLVLVILTLLLTPIGNVAASPAPAPQSTMQADIDRAMRYRDKIERVFNGAKRSYGSMVYQTLSRFRIGDEIPFIIALAAKESGGRKRLLRDNYIGLFQILGFGPFQQYEHDDGFPIDNRKLLTGVKRNTKEAILLLDRILEKIWKPTFFYNTELIKVAERFHCTPNRYEDIVYSCDGGQAWGEDFYYNYYPAAKKAYYGK